MQLDSLSDVILAELFCRTTRSIECDNPSWAMVWKPEATLQLHTRHAKRQSMVTCVLPRAIPSRSDHEQDPMLKPFLIVLAFLDICWITFTAWGQSIRLDTS
jgi:hypothetical protein